MSGLEGEKRLKIRVLDYMADDVAERIVARMSDEDRPSSMVLDFGDGVLVHAPIIGGRRRFLVSNHCGIDRSCVISFEESQIGPCATLIEGLVQRVPYGRIPERQGRGRREFMLVGQGMSKR